MSYSETVTRNDLTNILNEVLPSVAVDYIVEQGTSGDWTYRKWDSGLYEAWASTSDSYAMTSSFGSSYFGNHTYNITALSFVTLDCVFATGYASGAYFATKAENISTTSIELSARASASTTTTIVHSIYLKGTWK